jgi:hypothetical protein
MSMRVDCPEGHPTLVNASRLGAVAICPRCFASFLVEIDSVPSWHARKQDSKARRARDDDDDDEDVNDEERPRKKTKAKKAKEDDEDNEEEKPRRKSQMRKRMDEDDEDEEDDEKDEDEDEEDEDEGEPEEPIEWTPRKRQLNICSHGLIAMMVACFFLIAFTIFTSLWIDIFELFRSDWALSGFYWFSLPLAYLGLTAFVVGMAFNLAAPAKAEAKGALIAAIVFAGLIYLLGFLTLLTSLGVLVSDPARAERFVQLLTGGSLICFVLCMVSTMAYLSKLMVFMKLHLDASQPITNIGFILLAFALLLGLVFLSPLLKSWIGDWTCYIVALVADAITAYAIYMLVLHVNLIVKVRRTIGTYIKEG